MAEINANGVNLRYELHGKESSLVLTP